MVPPILRITIQAALLNALSNFLAQLISSWRTNTPFTIDLHNLAAFVTFSLISSPPNYLWQTWLEATFPGYAPSLASQEKEKLVDEVVAGSTTGRNSDKSGLTGRHVKHAAMTKDSAVQNPAQAKKKLNIRNTVVKFLLDQTFGASANTVLFLIGIAMLQGRSFEQGWTECKAGFWPLIRAGHRLWPAVCIINMTLVPVERRMIVGSLVGVGWSIFLSFLSSKTKTA